MASTSPAAVCAVRHSDFGLRMMKMSLCSTPMGSVGISELPSERDDGLRPRGISSASSPPWSEW